MNQCGWFTLTGPVSQSLLVYFLRSAYSQFLPRDVMHKRGLCRHAVSVCLSVSVTFVHFVKANKYIFKIFSRSGSHTILVFPYQTAWRYSDGNPPPRNGGVECRWGTQKPRFWANIWLYCLLNENVVLSCRPTVFELNDIEDCRDFVVSLKVVGNNTIRWIA